MTPERVTSRERRGVRRLARVAVAVATGAAVLTAIPAAAHDQDLPPGRRVMAYTVKSGDTATELAVRFHAWTRELISYNHLGSGGRMYVGQRLRIPVVVAAERRDRARTPKRKAAPRKATAPVRKARPAKRRAKAHRADPTRAQVRRVIIRTARRVGVDPELALAISWQEAGWKMHHVSSANAIGAMQVIPTTGTWMSLYAGRRLNLRSTRDNVLAGVLLLKVLDDQTRRRAHQIGAYYQGLGAVRRHGLYDETVRYVANVKALKRRLERGWNPA